MRNVQHILNRKPRKVIAVPPNMNVIEALQIMSDNNIGSVVVMNDSQYQGIMTERDYSRKVILKGKHSDDTSVAEIMSVNFPTVNPKDSIETCIKLMSEQNVRYLPVVESNLFINVISIKDVVDEQLLQQKDTINHLQSYITGSY